MIKDTDVTASGNAMYACQNPLSFTAEKVNDDFYRLRNSKGNGICTYDAENSYSNATVDIASNTPTFNNESVGVSVHHCTEKMYDYLLHEHDRNSIDGNGFKLRSWVHYGSNYNNAFWNGSWMTYGDGDGNTFSPLVSADVTGHEIAHGLTDYTANLIYSYESGALNEGFSDIFGILLEYYIDEDCADWIMGEDFTVAAGKYGLRNMSNPNDASMLTRQPDTYHGDFWYFGSGDYGGVHYNSGVLNYWFYLMTMGGSGTNDNGLSYSVTALANNENISREKAGAIAFRTLTVYLFDNAQYADARTASIQAAKDLYGENSNEVQTVTNAWCAVGVGDCAVVNNKSITITSPNGGESWSQGTTKQITWTTEGNISDVNIDLSINGGATWEYIAFLVNNDGNYSFTLPNSATTQAKIRIRDVYDNMVYDVSDNCFTIESCDVSSAFENDNNEVCEDQSISFNNTSINASSYQWFINDNLVATTENISYTFQSAGSYVIKLVARKSNNCSDEYSKTITVNALADASFTHTSDALDVSFFAIYQNANFYQWKQGSTTIGNTANLNYTFSSAGMYNICLNVGNECGTTVKCENIVVETPPCNSLVSASFELPNGAVCSNTSAIFTNTTTGANAYEWSVNGVNVGTSTNLTYSFPTAGDYTITLKAIDNNNCEDIFSETITINHNASELDLGENISLCEAANIVLDTELDDMLFTIWDYEGTNVGTTQSITASEAGTYSVSVLDQCGNATFSEISIVLGSDGCVWPGDMNNDGVVNHYDVLALGFAFGETGAERLNASINWEAQACESWEGMQANGVNFKHADANGNGLVDENDADAIDANYGQTHSETTNNFDETSPISITPILASNNTLEPLFNTYTFDLMLNEENGENLTAYSVAFTVDCYVYETLASITDINVNLTASWLGTPDELKTIWRYFPETNQIEIAVTRIDRKNQVGQGKIGYVELALNTETANLNELTVDFDVHGIQLMMSNATAIPVGNSNASFTFNNDITGNLCGTPTNLNESDLTCDAVTLTWDAMPDAEAYQLAGRKAGGQVKVFPEIQNNFRTFNGGLQTNTTYEWSVHTKCDGVWTDYAPLQSFTTPTCKNSTYKPANDPFFTNQTHSFFSQINLYPNPAKNNLNISFTSFSKEIINVKVIDILGKTVLAEKIESLQGENNFMLNVKDLQKGSYFLQIDENVQKFIIY